MIEKGLVIGRRWLIAFAMTTACGAGGDEESDDTKAPTGGSGSGDAAVGGTGGANAGGASSGCPAERPGPAPCIVPEPNFCGPYSTREACVCSGEMPTWMCFEVGG